MAKKTRTIFVRSEEMEMKVYNQCDMLNIKNKDIATRDIGNSEFLIDIYCGTKKWDQLTFKLGLGKCSIWW